MQQTAHSLAFPFLIERPGYIERFRIQDDKTIEFRAIVIEPLDALKVSAGKLFSTQCSRLVGSVNTANICFDNLERLFCLEIAVNKKYSHQYYESIKYCFHPGAPH